MNREVVTKGFLHPNTVVALKKNNLRFPMRTLPLRAGTFYLSATANNDFNDDEHSRKRAANPSTKSRRWMCVLSELVGWWYKARKINWNNCCCCCGWFFLCCRCLDTLFQLMEFEGLRLLMSVLLDFFLLVFNKINLGVEHFSLSLSRPLTIVLGEVGTA